MSDNERNKSDPEFEKEGEALLIKSRIEKLEEEQKEAQKRDEDYKKRQATYSGWVARFTGFLVVTSLITNLIYLDMSCTARKNANAAKSAAETANITMKLAYRPRVTLLGINPLVQSTVDGKLVTTLDNGRLKVGIDLPNTGQFAARNVRIFRFDNVSPRERIAKLPYEELMGEPKVIPPKATNSSTNLAIFGKRIVSKSELVQLQKGDLWVTFSVLVTYDDDFGETHHTEYCTIFTLQPYNDICPWPVQND